MWERGRSDSTCIGAGFSRRQDIVQTWTNGKRMKVSSVTHRGLVRRINEDRFLVKETGNGSLLVAIADGMGGHVAGERAAEIAVQTMSEFEHDSAADDASLVELARMTNCRIMEASARDLSLTGMGTTLTAAFVTGMTAHWVHVGDSRLYVFREGELAVITEDHTVAGLLARSGEINAEEARFHPMRKVLMSCIRGAEFEMDSGCLDLEKGDLLVLSTDGLHDRVAEDEIVRILGSSAGLDDKTNALIQSALKSGGMDNITVVAIQI